MKEEEINLWIQENRLLFNPSNKKPNQQEMEWVFKIANVLDTSQVHKMTSCGRCYHNAKKVIEKYIQIIEL